MAGHWDECENPDCRKFYWSMDKDARFCDRSCARRFQHMSRRAPREELIALINEFMRQPEINHDPHIKRAALRIFGR